MISVAQAPRARSCPRHGASPIETARRARCVVAARSRASPTREPSNTLLEDVRGAAREHGHRARHVRTRRAARRRCGRGASASTSLRSTRPRSRPRSSPTGTTADAAALAARLAGGQLGRARALDRRPPGAARCVRRRVGATSTAPARRPLASPRTLGAAVQGRDRGDEGAHEEEVAAFDAATTEARLPAPRGHAGNGGA